MDSTTGGHTIQLKAADGHTLDAYWRDRRMRSAGSW